MIIINNVLVKCTHRVDFNKCYKIINVILTYKCKRKKNKTNLGKNIKIQPWNESRMEIVF